MHSVKKVEEKARLERIEKRKKKMAEVDAVRKLIFKCYENISGNERKILDMTEGMLPMLPDVYTFWVMRRDVLLKVKEDMEKDSEYCIWTKNEVEQYWRKIENQKKRTTETEQKEKQQIAVEEEQSVSDVSVETQVPDEQKASEDFACGESADRPISENIETTEEVGLPRPPFVELIDNEIKLTEAALFNNPKSYSAWNHRKWAMEIHETPPLKKELLICEKALSIDCRNFHVWDYRRFIVQKLNRTEEQELEFGQEMVKKNPSNYSAWHYRISQLLEGGEKLSDEMFVTELRGVTENCVVNSEDQTAWTYVNWLIDRFFNYPEEKLGIDDLISFTENPKFDDKFHSTLVFYSAVNADTVRTFLEGDGHDLKPRIHGLSDVKYVYAYIWDVYSNSEILFSIAEEDLEGFYCSETPRKRFVNQDLLQKIFTRNPPSMSESVKECLNFFLESCVELMKENSESNPWEICAQATVLPLIKGINSEVEQQVKDLLKKAKKSDPQRIQMYESMKDKIVLINILHEIPIDETILEMLIKKDGILDIEFIDYTNLRYLAGLLRISKSDEKTKLDPQLVWFLSGHLSN